MKIIKKFKKLILFINYNILLVNLYLLLKINKFNNKIYFRFKISDYFNINLLNMTYNQISNYLNNKYNNNFAMKNNKQHKNETMNQFKKILKIYSVDLFDRNYHLSWLKDKIEDNFIIQIEPNNPDYLIYNAFGENHLDPKYNNSIKIAILTENKIPDLNKADYCIGHAHINYLDRYFKYSVLLWTNYKDINKMRKQLLNNRIRAKFCAAVISNYYSGDQFRLDFINELNKYKKIDMGGRYQNNIGQIIKNKTEFLSSYKFSIAMENSNGDGYISEKIIDSFISGTIPIYYGDYMLDEYINPKTYILIKSEKDIKNKINYIKAIDNDDNLYRKILEEKVIIDENFSDKIDYELKLFLNHIFEQDKLKSTRINN